MNLHNRYGGMVVHEITPVYDPSNKKLMQRTTDVLRWYLEYGVNVEIKGNDVCAELAPIRSTRAAVSPSDVGRP